MSLHAVQVEGLAKHYRIGRPGRQTLREALSAALAFRRVPARRSDAENGSDLWALKDVNFTLEPGEILGVIGRNGAGKSTLLKILARVTEPTAGRVVIRGRLSS